MAAPPGPGRRPLDGIRVLDFTSMIAGPNCTRLLADCGAEVLKIEEPGGDHMRKAPPLRDGHSSYFGHLNAGKKSLAIDLKSDAGRDIARRLAASSDVVVENFRPGVMRRLGLDYAALSGRRSDIVYCSISGFGQHGPRADQSAYAPIVHAVSGYDLTQLHYQSGGDDVGRERPDKTGIFVADVLAAVYAFGAIQTALIGRLRHCVGQFIDVALMDAMLNLLIFECQEAQFPLGRRRPLYVPMRASDGFVIVTPINQRNFEQLADVTGNGGWKADPRFATVADRLENWDALMDAIEDWTSRHSARQCEGILGAAGVPCSRYLTVAQAMADPQIEARGTLANVVDGAGAFQMPNPPFRFNDNSTGVSGRVPALGADTSAVLSQVLSLAPAEIDGLKRRGIIGGS